MFWKWWLVLLWLAGLSVIGSLMWGGLAGLPYVENERWGGLILTLLAEQLRHRACLSALDPARARAGARTCR